MNRKTSREELIYNYPLYSLRRFPVFIRYCIPVAKKIGTGNGSCNNWLRVLLDMIWCNFRYGAMDSREYLLFDFWKKPHNLKKTYFTKRRYFRLIKKFDYDVFSKLIEKQNQYKEYSSFIHRHWFFVNDKCSEEELFNFISAHKEIIAKPVSSDCGRGIEKLTILDKDKILEIYANRNEVQYLMEEVVNNCHEFQLLNPGSLNTVRVTYVINKKNEPNIFSVMLRSGVSQDVVVDNWGGGGILMDVDIESGIVLKPGLNEQGVEFAQHPITKTKLIGFKIPRYKEMLKFAKKVAMANPKVVYGGLDIAITDDAFELIEINFPPASIGYQSFGKGYLHEIEEICI